MDVRVVDLSAPLSAATILWPGGRPLTAEVLGEVDRDGNYSRRVTLDEHSGTHFDAPCHFATGLADVADIPADDLFRPLRVVDIADLALRDPDVALSVSQVLEHERHHGQIAEGDAVFLRTGWDYALDTHRELSQSDPPRFPGFGVDAARMLVDDRGVRGLGIDTLSIDAGTAREFPVHKHVSLPRGIWHVENLVNLDAVPAVGAWVVVGVPRVVAASGFPARVLALLPTNVSVTPQL